MDYENISKKTVNHIYAAYASLAESPLDPQIRCLVELRTSQINGCAYCCNMHNKDARKAGITQQKLDELLTWNNSEYFNDREKIALSWCEAITIAKSKQTSLRHQLKEYFDNREIVDLTLIISLMNALNRIAVNLRDDE